MSSTIPSRVRGLVERFSKAFAMLATSLRRSNGSCVRSRFTTRRSDRSISSYVVKRYLHFKHSRRRRMLELSRYSRESMTLSSRDPHLGQRIVLDASITHNQLYRHDFRRRNSCAEKLRYDYKIPLSIALFL